MKHGQWIDRAIERQFAPQPGEDVGAPFMGDVRRLQVVQPDRRHRMTGIAQPGETVTGKHHAPVAVAERAFGAGGADAACLRNHRCDRVLTAEAVLQQDQLGICAQARGEAGDRAFGVIGFAGDQQATDPLRVSCRLRGDRIGGGCAVLDQGQPAGRLIAAQTFGITHDQPHRQTRAGQTRGPEGAEAAGAENVPGGGHQFFTR